MIRRIVVIGVILILIVAGVMVASTAAPAVALDSAPAAVHIACVWQRSNGQSANAVMVRSLGTLIAPNVILTHNHYGPTLGQQPTDTFTINDKAGHIWKWRASEVQLIVINAGTAVIWLPEYLPLPATGLANSADLQRLAANQWLTVDYWDESHAHLARHDFQILKITDGIARLADPDRLIRPGDSGGGAYLNSKLIGNIWSINLDSDRRPLGSFNVALLPSQVRSYAK
jgi:hypothetical protein